MKSTGVDGLDGAKVEATIVRLAGRIDARFPGRGLTLVARELGDIVKDTNATLPVLHRRTTALTWITRALAAAIVLGTAVIFAIALRDAVRHGPDQSFEWVPLIESTINDLVFAGLAVFFLTALPERVERREVLTTLHRLRSLAHIVDMHQLTKDPERLRPGFEPTTKSVPMNLGRDDLEHYLDYCSELLSLIGKVAALCADQTEDGIVLDTVSTIETMTTQMAGKIWQKISLLPD